ncbi:hypothetical protein E2C01_039617 [Portunus trituberculatus]|uniref:Uncharacterized protein n=1 Tax=Portunus trituberculatus TaxID=210409 RepID=A0A5B7FF71_PORTR|nr:hypothetical protein [Portunus trituberculatus]
MKKFLAECRTADKAAGNSLTFTALMSGLTGSCGRRRTGRDPHDNKETRTQHTASCKNPLGLHVAETWREAYYRPLQPPPPPPPPLGHIAFDFHAKESN